MSMSREISASEHRSIVAGLERRIATLESERNEAFAARDAAERAMRDMGRSHDARVTELLAANTREVERRREAEAKVARLNSALWAMMYGHDDDEVRREAFAALGKTDDR